MAPAQGWHAKSWSVPHFLAPAPPFCRYSKYLSPDISMWKIFCVDPPILIQNEFNCADCGKRFKERGGRRGPPLDESWHWHSDRQSFKRLQDSALCTIDNRWPYFWNYLWQTYIISEIITWDLNLSSHWIIVCSVWLLVQKLYLLNIICDFGGVLTLKK